MWFFISENGLVDGQETNGKKESPAEVAPAQPAQPAPAAAPQQESPIQSGTAEPPLPTTSSVQGNQQYTVLKKLFS